MLLGDRGSRWRCLLVWAAGTFAIAAATAALVGCAPPLRPGDSGVTSLPVDALLERVAACALLVCAGWAWVALTVTVLEARHGGLPSRCGPWRLPSGVRRIVLAACGVALASALASPAHADANAHGDGHTRIAHHGLGVLRGLPLPERAVAPPRPDARPRPRPEHVVTVRPGDTLWAIAARDLPADAPDLDVSAHWHAIYAANRRAIGPDPDLVRPGQQLRLPPLPRKDRL